MTGRVVLSTSWTGDGVAVTTVEGGGLEVAYDPDWTTAAEAWEAVAWMLAGGYERERGAA